MFGQQYRLRRRQDIERVVKRGRSVFDPVCGLRFLPNDLSVSRFAIVVGTKVHKSAVKRNRVRRQYREIIRLHLTNIRQGYDVVLFTSQKSLELTYGQQQDLLLRVFQKAGLWVR